MQTKVSRIKLLCRDRMKEESYQSFRGTATCWSSACPTAIVMLMLVELQRQTFRFC
jgi:hypothetical protein